MTAPGDPRAGNPRTARLRALQAAGLADSAGLAFGWTVFLLLATARQGLAVVAVYQVAMLVGTATSAQFSAWVSSRLTAREQLRTLAIVEAPCRVLVFVLLLYHAPVSAEAALVFVMNVVAWSGYAAMRAEVAAVEVSANHLTRYAVTVITTEALAAAAAAFVPIRSSLPTLPLIIGLYAASLVPTWLVAAGARAVRAERFQLQAAVRRPRTLLTGAAVMLLAAGPTLLAVPLAETWYGHVGVAVATLSFAAGSFAAPRLARRIERRNVATRAVWALLGALMVGGWALAPLLLVGLAVAQLGSGFGQGALEGLMDRRVLAGVAPQQHTSALAGSAAARALGAAGSVALLPVVAGPTELSIYAAGAAALLAAVPTVRARWTHRRQLAPAGGVLLLRHPTPGRLGGQAQDGPAA